MDLYKLGVKAFAAHPAPVPAAEFIPVFQSWIQQQSLPGHLLLDVHDYSHVHHGPGILLVAHEGNFSLDSEDGRLSLFYYRKQPVAGDLAAQLRATIQTARTAAGRLAGDGRLPGLKFGETEFRVITNDRLLAPNDAATAARLVPLVVETFRHEFPGRPVTATPDAPDPRERFALRVQVGP